LLKRSAFFLVCLVCSVLAAKPKLAIVVDDVGASLAQCKKITAIAQTLNIAVVPGWARARQCAGEIDKSKHELLIHLPLGAMNKKPYPIRITEQMSEREMAQQLTKAFRSVPGSKGLNNHMGSAFCLNEQALTKFMKIYSKFKKNKYFFDSRTSSQTKAYLWAKKYGIKTVRNDVFLDGVQNKEYLAKQLRQAVALAKRRGFAAAICHGNRTVTLKELPLLLNQYDQEVEFVRLGKIIN
jgi:polysaccharide deacetylase 2 family uncharacterized protein YibQ